MFDSSLITSLGNTSKLTDLSVNNNSSTSMDSMFPIMFNSHEDLMENSWDFNTELIFIAILGILTIPANLFLTIFYIQKVRRYKRVKHLNARYARVANSFHTYMIEMCLFDTIIVIYLILDTSFQFLYYQKKSKYASVFDISNFACKFFIYVLRISGAMSNFLVFFLALNRSLLVMFRSKSGNKRGSETDVSSSSRNNINVERKNQRHQYATGDYRNAASYPFVAIDTISSYRICLNTKYLTLFLFCACTIANVFRLEMLNLNNSGNDTSKALATKLLGKNNSMLDQFLKFNNPTNEKLVYKRSIEFEKLFHSNLNRSKIAIKNTPKLNSSWTLMMRWQRLRRSAIQQDQFFETYDIEEPLKPIGEFNLSNNDLFMKNLQDIIKASQKSECGPSFSSISFTKSDTIDKLFWSIVIYNLLFVISPSIGNLLLSVYLIRKRSQLVLRLIWLTDNLINAKMRASFKKAKRRRPLIFEKTKVTSKNNEMNDSLGDRSATEKPSVSSAHNSTNKVVTTNLDEIVSLSQRSALVTTPMSIRKQSKQDNDEENTLNDQSLLTSTTNVSKPAPPPITIQISKSSKRSMVGFNYINEAQKYRLNEFHTEFLKTVTPCIAFSLTQSLLFLPYSLIELTNQIMPNMMLFNILQYMTYFRYIFYCSKFYILCLVSFRFRRDIVRCFKGEDVFFKRKINKNKRLIDLLENWPPR